MNRALLIVLALLVGCPNLARRDDDDTAGDDEPADPADFMDDDGDGQTEAEGDCDDEDPGRAGLLCTHCVVVATPGGDGDGTSWTTPFGTPQEAIDAAAARVAGGEPSCEVWLSEGTFLIYQGDVTDTVQLAPNVDVLGGFAPGSFDLVGQTRDPTLTVLEGEDVGVGRVLHVVTGADDSRLDTLTIARGNALGADEVTGSGGGLYNDGVSPEVIRVVFLQNDAEYAGGAVANLAGASPRINWSWFIENGANDGGAVLNSDGANAVFRTSAFLRNVARGSSGQGGAVRSRNGSEPVFAHCTFVGNVAPNGAALLARMATNNVLNSVFWDHDTAPIVNFAGGDSMVIYSLVEGDYPGEANLDADPLFVDPTNDDYTPGPGSPIIDAGEAFFAVGMDILGNEPVDDPSAENVGTGPPWADLGAFERQP